MSGPTHPLLLPAIAERASKRALSGRSIEREKVESLVDAARWAPSWGNRQPCRFVVVQDPAALERVRAALTQGNRWAWAAPLLVVLVADPDDEETRAGKPYYLFDGGLATQNLLLQAVHLGLVAHPMMGWDEEQLKIALGVPDPFRVIIVVAIGYPGRLADLEPGQQEKELRPRTRKPMSDTVFHDRFRSE
ncbi:MAG: nitroreductase family protein [Chloroflexi bacterium]|nr:nitroreductase family protein [Chloroflexota bacterium]